MHFVALVDIYVSFMAHSFDVDRFTILSTRFFFLSFFEQTVDDGSVWARRKKMKDNVMRVVEMWWSKLIFDFTKRKIATIVRGLRQRKYSTSCECESSV